MKTSTKLLALFVCLTLAFTACRQENSDQYEYEVSGIIKAQGITFYQYGTHAINGYALRSETINLDDFIDQEVTIKGNSIEGYPIEGGPEYIRVEVVKE